MLAHISYSRLRFFASEYEAKGNAAIHPSTAATVTFAMSLVDLKNLPLGNRLRGTKQAGANSRLVLAKCPPKEEGAHPPKRDTTRGDFCRRKTPAENPKL